VTRAFVPARRMARLPEQFFADLVARTEARKAAGHDVINLGQGNPIDPTPDHIVSRLAEAARDPRYHRYIPFNGLAALKEAGARWWETHHGVHLDPEREVAVVIGVKVALVELALITVNPGDVAVVPDPGYPDYWSGIALAGGRRVGLPVVVGDDSTPDFTEAPPDARLVYLNFPHNPTGRMAGPADFRRAVDYADRTGALLVHDLAYGDVAFDGRRALSLLAAPGGREVGVECLSLSKSYNMAGWRIGLVAGRADVIRQLEVIQDHLHCSQFGAIQEAAIAALDSRPEVTAAVAARYQARRDALIGGLAEAGWSVPAPEGGIFCWAPVPDGRDGGSLAEFLLEHADVMVAPGIGFGTQGRAYVRFSLTAEAGRLKEAAARIARVLPVYLETAPASPRT
jgi:aminotransferase